MNILYLDLETTGFDSSKDEIIQAAYKINGQKNVHSEIFKAQKPIPFEISGLTNIDQEDVADKGLFADSKAKQDLIKYTSEGYVIVTHNTDFDLEFLAANGVKFEKEICTLMVARKLIGKKLFDHKLGTLRAYYHIPVPDRNNPHDARYDVEVLANVFEKMRENFKSIDEMIDYTKKAREEMLQIWRFGKYKGEKINKQRHIEYILWYLNQPESPKYRRDPKFIDYLKKIANL
jgi:DNA polymerase III epsilon subunit-like protein